MRFSPSQHYHIEAVKSASRTNIYCHFNGFQVDFWHNPKSEVNQSDQKPWRTNTNESKGGQKVKCRLTANEGFSREFNQGALGEDGKNHPLDIS